MAPNSPAYSPPPDDGLAIRYIDDALLVVDKPAGLLSVPGRGADKQDSLASRVQARYPDARVVHRLDMSTSGLMMLALDADIQRALGRQFELRCSWSTSRRGCFRCRGAARTSRTAWRAGSRRVTRAHASCIGWT